MSSVLKIKRRVTGGVGAPTSLKNGEVAFNEVDNTLYYGKGNDGAGNATSIVSIGGVGKFVDTSSNQTVGGVKTFSSSPSVPTPAGDSDAANKAYVDSVIQGLDIKQSVRVASSTNVSLASPGASVDGVTMVSGDRVLLFGQTTASQNGIYVWTGATSALTRSSDANTAAEIESAFVFVEEGTYADSGYVMVTNAPITLETTALTWTQFSGAGQITAGNGLTKTGNTIDVVANNGIAVEVDSIGLTGQALALHNLASNGIIARTGAGTVSARSITTSGTGLSVSNGDGVAGNPTVSLSSALSTVGGLTPATDRIAYYTSASNATLATLTAYGRSLIAAADANAAISALGLGTMATQNASAVAITGGTIDGITLDGGTF